MAYKIGDTTVIDNSRELTAVGVTPSTNLVIPSGTTSNRPTGAVGKLYFDTDLGKLLVHDGTSWIVASSAAGFETLGDFATHGAKYVMPLGGGTNNSERTVTPFPYNEAITSISITKDQASAISNEMFDAYVKFKGMQDEVQLLNSSDVGGTGGWPNPPRPGQHQGVYNVDRNSFQPHASLSLDDTAVNVNIGGEPVNMNQPKRVHSWLFDSKFPNEGFVMTTRTLWTANTQRGGYGIYKYSDTQYITWGCENVVGNSGSVALSTGKIELRSFNPNNIAEKHNATAATAYADWYKRYTPTRGQLLYTAPSGGQGGGMCYGVWKSATPNQLTVMTTNNQSLNENTYLNPSQPFIGIFDINVNTGAVVPASTTSHLEFSPTVNGNAWVDGVNVTALLPSANNFTVCECSTHVTMITWPGNSRAGPYVFWIYDKANRDLRCFKPEIYDNTTFNNAAIDGSAHPNRLWMNHFKMNDKIYLTTCEQGNTHTSHEGVYMYETSSTSATPYMRIYNDTNNHQAIGTPQQFQQIRALKSADSFTFQHNHASDLLWMDSSGNFTYSQLGDGTQNTGLTVNPETSKTIIQTTFKNVKSGAWSGSTPTYRVNPGKFSFATADITRWSDVDGDNTPPNNPGATAGGLWAGNLSRRKFFGGLTQ